MEAQGEARTSLVRDQLGPAFDELRPLKEGRSTGFPVYPDLVEMLAGSRPGDHPLPAVAHALAVCSGYAYSDVGTVAMMATRLGLERNRCREVSRTVDAMLIRSTAFVVQSADGRVVIVAYRGTPPLDLTTWLLNADVEAVEGVGELGLHAGFYRNVRATRPEVLWALEAAAAGRSILGAATDQTYVRGPEPRRERSAPALERMQALYLTGHSLGGAMAAVLARMLVDEPNYRPLADRLAGVYTYGQPMVATPEAAAEAERSLAERGVPLIRYVHRNDPVPRLPPAYTGRFAHFGQERRFVASWPDRPSPTTTQSPPWRLELAAGVAAYVLRKITPLRDLPWTANLEHHLPHHYVAALALPGKPSEFGIS